MKSKKLKQVIEKIMRSQDYWNLNYYMRSMKRSQHGGVFNIKHPNMFLKYYPFSAHHFFIPNAEIPFPVLVFSRKAISYIYAANVGEEELLEYCFGINSSKAKTSYGSKMYIASCGKVITSANRTEIEHMNAVIDALEGRINFTDNFTINYDRLIYLFVLLLIEESILRINDVHEVVVNEHFEEPVDKYGLTNVTKADFKRQGFVLGNQYYLYNIFFDTSLGNPTSKTPATIDIIKNIEIDLEIRMRCDRNLAVPISKMVNTATTDFQKWRGITLNFGNFENQLINAKETIVHYDENTMHKVLVYIKRGTDHTGKIFYHLNVEQLWNPGILLNDEEIVITNYVHGTYYPESETFEHIDYSVNQYEKAVYKEKYHDSAETSGVSIGEYGNHHYKIWCVRGRNLTSRIWAELVCATLDVPFRRIFMETIDGTYIEED